MSAPLTDEQFADLQTRVSADAWIGVSREETTALLTTVEQLSAELDRRIEAEAEALADKTMLKELSVKDGALTLEAIPPHEIVAAWVHAARAMLGDAPNYSETEISMPADSGVSMEFTQAGDYETYVFTVQRKGRMTPHQARLAAEKRAEQAEAAVARVRAAHPEADGRCTRCRMACDCWDQAVAADADLSDLEDLGLRWSECPHPAEPYPCPTIRALDGTDAVPAGGVS